MQTIQLQIAIAITEEVAENLATALAPAIRQALLPKPSEDDLRREARLKASRNAIFAGQKPPEDQGLLIDTREVAKLLKLSSKTIFVMSRDGRMPPPIKIGSAVRWGYDALKKWVDAGCPSQ